MKKSKRPLELTDDLVTNIIIRAPYKALMRFKCVSRSWCSLITTDPYFSQLRSKRPSLIIQKTQYCRCCLSYNYWVELDSIEDGNPNPRQIHNPFDHDDHRLVCVIASCEGLLVLEQYTNKMVVSNPTTKKHHVVPPNPAGDDNVRFMGFGYDRVHDCYKLVTKIKRDDPVVELVIYNVNNCTWKKSRFDGLDKLKNDVGVCVNDALYWPVYIEAKIRKIVCFVLAEEEFHDVDLPDLDEVMYAYAATLFDGRLGLMSGDSRNRKKKELWLMECDNSYCGRWIKFLSISDPELAPPPHGYNYSCMVPICSSACGNKTLFNVGFLHLFWYDQRENKFTMLTTPINELSDHGFQTIHVSRF